MIKEGIAEDLMTTNPRYDHLERRGEVSLPEIGLGHFVRNLLGVATLCLATLCMFCMLLINDAKAVDPTPTSTPIPTATPTVTPTPCPDSSFEEDKDDDGLVACGEDFCDRDPLKQSPGNCGCQYQDTFSSSCADPQNASISFCQFIANATQKKITSRKTVRTMRLGWRMQTSLQGKVEYRCQVYELKPDKSGILVERLIKIDRNSVLKRTIDNKFTEPFGDNSPILQPTPIPVLFEIRAKESSVSNKCDTKPLSQLISNSRVRKTCRCTKSVPDAGLWCHDLKVTDPKTDFSYRVRCRLRGRENGFQNVFTSESSSRELFVGMDQRECR